MALIPPIGAAGIYQLGAPYNGLLTTGVSYTCNAIRQMGDFVKRGVDPYTEYYKPYNLSEQVYTNDVQAGVSIVSLRSSGGHWVYVPTSYILSYPNIGGISYTGLVLAANLGPVPDYLDLTALKAKIRDVIIERIGIQTTEITTVAVTEKKLLTQADHIAIEAARAQNISDITTDYSKYLSEKNRADSLQTRLAELEAYVAANHIP